MLSAPAEVSAEGTNHGPAQLLENAVKFLQDPQVRNSNISRRIEFLEKKGLSRAEIEEAMRRAEIGPLDQPQSPFTTQLPPPLPALPPPPLESTRLTAVQLQPKAFDWGKFALVIALIGSAGMALSQSFIFRSIYRLILRIKRRLVGGKREQDPTGDDEEESVSQLKRDVSLMGQLLASVQESIKLLQDRVKHDLDSLKISQNYQYAELSRDIEEIREGVLCSAQSGHCGVTDRQGTMDVMRT